MPDVVEKPEALTPAQPSLEVNFALVLSRMIESVEKNPEELRASIFELARVKLKEQVSDGRGEDAQSLMGALETAIAGVESFAQKEAGKSVFAEPLIFLPNHRTNPSGPANVEILRAQGDSRSDDTASLPRSDYAVVARAGVKLAARGGRVTLSRQQLIDVTRLAVVLAFVAALGAGALYWSRFRVSSGNAATQGADMKVARPEIAEPKPADRKPPPEAKQTPTLPLPSTYGIYAVNEGRLYELKPLAGKVPDPRVAMSAPVTAASETTLPTGAVKFVVFRRDSAVNAPDRADIRIVAKVRRALGVNASGKATMTQAQDTWVVRNIAVSYKIGPVEDHPEMYLLQPQEAELSLAPGRYVLVIKGQGLDFEVAGLVTDPRQCLERVDAVNGAFYSPCPER